MFQKVEIEYILKRLVAIDFPRSEVTKYQEFTFQG